MLWPQKKKLWDLIKCRDQSEVSPAISWKGYSDWLGFRTNKIILYAEEEERRWQQEGAQTDTEEEASG